MKAHLHPRNVAEETADANRKDFGREDPPILPGRLPDDGEATKAGGVPMEDLDDDEIPEVEGLGSSRRFGDEVGILVRKSAAVKLSVVRSSRM